MDINLFNTDANDIALPSEELNNSDTDELASESIDSAILGDKVKTLLIPEQTEVAESNYIFDFSDAGAISIMQKSALKALVNDSGDVELYLYNSKNGLISFGMGDKYILERTIPLIRKFVFDDKIKVYKNFKVGETPVEVTTRDITKMRLNL